MVRSLCLMPRRPFGHGPIAWVLKRASVLLLAAALVSLAWLRLDSRTLPGIRVANQPLARTKQPERALQEQARVFMSKQVEIRTGPYLTVATRAELGARLAVPAMSRKLLALGRSGNPFLDLSTLLLALFDGVEVGWLPVVDRSVLGRYIQAVRRNVERPPVAGATDGQGWSIAGVAGTTLDTVSTVDALEKVLRRGGLAIEVPLREVPAPQALAIGSPDAVLYGDDPQNTAPSIDAPHLAELDAILARVRPREWQPEHGKECDLDPGYEGFCQGPRRVPRPFGPAAQLAHVLGLGEVETVGHLLGNDPTRDWIEAAGGPPHDDSLLWPVPGGQLWRGFGFVRTGAYRDKLHRGVDIGAPRGTPIVAINDGVVAYSDNRVRGYGNLLVIIHGDGSVSLSAHCIETFVFAGQHVRRGQIIGAVGDTGFARGTHVHFEYHRAGRPVDPQARFVQPSSGTQATRLRRAG
jgi:hypothetical protein